MTVLIVGLGTIGRRHARNLKRINSAIALRGCRTLATTTDDLGEDASLFQEIHYNLERAVASPPTVGIVATPASRHIEDARVLAQAGAHVFIEKPMSNRLDGVETLIDECRQGALCLMVGYNLRFDPSLQAAKTALDEGRIGRLLSFRAEVGQYLPDWRPGRDYRDCVSAREALGGGPLLELSHEFDYVRWLVGDARTVAARAKRVGLLDIDVPDVAVVLLETAAGAMGSIHFDMLDRSPVRGLRVVGTDGTIVWDAVAHTTKLFAADTRQWVTLSLAETPSAGTNTYLSEMDHYLSCVSAGTAPLVSGEDGMAALRMAMAAAKSAQTGRPVAL